MGIPFLVFKEKHLYYWKSCCFGCKYAQPSFPGWLRACGPCLSCLWKNRTKLPTIVPLNLNGLPCMQWWWGALRFPVPLWCRPAHCCWNFSPEAVAVCRTARFFILCDEKLHRKEKRIIARALRVRWMRQEVAQLVITNFPPQVIFCGLQST